MLAPNMEGTKPTPNRHPTHLLIANTMQPSLERRCGMAHQRWAQGTPDRVRPHLNWAQMAPTLVCCLHWASRWVLQSLAPFGDDLIWVLAFFSTCVGPDLPG